MTKAAAPGDVVIKKARGMVGRVLKKNADFKAAYDYLSPEVARAARRQYNSDQTPQRREGK